MKIWVYFNLLQLFTIDFSINSISRFILCAICHIICGSLFDSENKCIKLSFFRILE